MTLEVPMRLPPLNALRAFEAAGTHNSFGKAAEELNVSSGAITRHVKLLEAHFDSLLFERRAQGVRLTVIGQRLLPKVTAAFELIAGAASEIGPAPSRLRLLASPTFANRRLIPNLTDFIADWPDLDVSVRVLMAELHEIPDENYDCRIVTTHVTSWPDGIRSMRVIAEELTPVCAPSLI